MMIKNALAVFVVLLYGDISAATSSNSDDFCGAINSTLVDINKMTGHWYGNEHLQHNVTDRLVSNTSSCCIIVTISQEVSQENLPPNVQPNIYETPPNRKTAELFSFVDPSDIDKATDSVTSTDKRSHNYLRLIWDDNCSGAVEYTLDYNETKPGTWRTTNVRPSHNNNSQRDEPYRSMHTGKTELRMNRGWNTTFLVMKWLDDHMVLTMCQDRRLVSVTLSRASAVIMLSDQDLESVSNLLQKHQLNIRSRKPLCVRQPIGDTNLGSYATPIFGGATVITRLMMVLVFIKFVCC